jgi:putative glycosyltransferase (TIGR04372 family)
MRLLKTNTISTFVTSLNLKHHYVTASGAMMIWGRRSVRYGFWFPLGLLVFTVLRVLQPLLKIRIGLLAYERIGNLAPQAELYLRCSAREKIARKERLLFVSGEPSNRQLLTMIKRNLCVLESHLILEMYHVVRRFMRNSDLWIDLSFHVGKNEYDDFGKISQQLKFTDEEEARGRQIRRNIGILDGEQFVCFHSRDSAYLETVHTWRTRREWSYHDHRDCDVGNYLRAAEYLASLGLFSVRMGYVVRDALPIKNARIIDYATLHRSDFGDMYLPAKCKFFLGSDGGLITIPWTFNVPVAYANSIPVYSAAWRQGDLFIPKKLWLSGKKRFLTFREILKRGAGEWHNREWFEGAGIEVIENTPEEILALTKEMNDRLDGRWITTEEDEKSQRRYRALISPDHRVYGFPSRVGSEFLRQNCELLD